MKNEKLDFSVKPDSDIDFAGAFGGCIMSFEDRISNLNKVLKITSLVIDEGFKNDDDYMKKAIHYANKLNVPEYEIWSFAVDNNIIKK